MFDNSRFFVGIVKDNDDTHRPNAEDQRQGKVQVRILGVHDILNTPDTNEGRGVDDKDLPWCACLMPNIFGGVATQGTVPNPSLQIGAWVFGVSLDETFQNNIILGIICLPQNMAPSSLASGGVGGGGMGGPIGMVNLSSSCLDKHQLVLLGCESQGVFEDKSGNVNLSWERALEASANQGAQRNTKMAGVFQIEPSTAQHYAREAIKQGVVIMEGVTPEQAYQKARESPQYNVALGKFIATTKMKEAAAATGSTSLLFAAGLYNVGSGNFAHFVNYLNGKYGKGNLKNMEDQTIANEYQYWFGGPGKWQTTKNKKTGEIKKQDISGNRTYLQKYIKFMNGMGGQNCFEEARKGSDLTKMPEGVEATGNELANRMLQELQKMGHLTYSQDYRMSKNHADCSSLTSRITYALGLTPRNDYTTSDMFNKEVLVKTGNFERAAILTTYQLNDQYLKPGDIVVCQGHAEIYLGGNKWIGARGSGVGVHNNDKAWSVSHKGKQCKIFRRKQ